MDYMISIELARQCGLVPKFRRQRAASLFGFLFRGARPESDEAYYRARRDYEDSFCEDKKLRLVRADYDDVVGRLQEARDD